MRIITLVLAILFFSSAGIYGQANLVVEAPLNDNTNGVNRAPNGTSAHAFLRACYLVLQSELGNIPSGTNISSLGFTMTTGTTGAAVPGNITVYLQNTTDVTYLKGLGFATATTAMTNVYASVITIPVSAVTTSVVVTLSSAFLYTGNGLYLAYDYNSTGPFATTGAVYLGETTALPLPGGGGAFAASGTSAPTTMVATNSRPSFLFGFTNANNNDIAVVAIEAPGKVNVNFNAPHVIKAYVKNMSNIAKTNISVNLNITGGNTFANPQSIPSLAPGAGVLVSFSPFNPSTLGLNTLSVSVGSDQNNANNSAVYMQSVTCNQWAMNPPMGSYTINSVGFGTGAGIFLTPYLNPVSSLLGGISGAISLNAPNIGQQLCGALLNSSGVIVATTNTVTVTSGMLGTFQTFTFPTPVSLSAATPYYFGVAQINPNSVAYYPAGTLGSHYQSSTLYAYTGINGGALTILTNNFGYFGLEAIFSSAAIPLTSSPATVCVGSCAMLTAPTGISNYTWSTGGNGNSISACPASALTNTYSVSATTSLGCAATGTITIAVNPLPNIILTSLSNTVCVGGTFSFTANGANTYSLNSIATTSTITQNPISNTIYTVSGTNVNSCVNTATIDVSIATLTVTVTSNTTVCKGSPISLTASGPSNYNYVWSDGILNIPFPSTQQSPATTTIYSLTATDGFCTITKTVQVGVSPIPTITVSSSKPSSCKGQSVTITASGAVTYSWSTSATGSSILVAPPTTTNYVVTGTNADNCSKSATFSQVINICAGFNELAENNSQINIFPNPNNGQFTIYSNDTELKKTVEIYNSLGALIKSLQLSTTDTIVDMGNEPNGLYIIKIINDKKMIQASRIIKQ